MNPPPGRMIRQDMATRLEPGRGPDEWTRLSGGRFRNQFARAAAGLPMQ